MTTVVYRMYDADDHLLYVGCSSQWGTRLTQHSQDKPWHDQVVRVTLEHFDDWREALRVEGLAQERENPVHNVVRNGKLPNLKARLNEKRQAHAEKVARHEADCRARGVYSQWWNCQNCRLVQQIEIPLGTLRDQHPCPRCGVAPHAHAGVAA